ncbi:MAG: hypothetical protein JW829_11890 [Pirellulales bacterium]|nr:hypothetical protein [Pirellulales bacterium]
MKSILGLFLSFAIILILAANTQACDGSCIGGYGIAYLYQHLDYKIPYFAAYPPVYYSYPIPRPYGYSPFAYPPGTQTPEIVEEPIQPETIINPYVEQPEKDASLKDADTGKVTSVRQPKPLIIINPFVGLPSPLVQVSQ